MNSKAIQASLSTLERNLESALQAKNQHEAEIARSRYDGPTYEEPEEALCYYLEHLYDLLLVVLEVWNAWAEKGAPGPKFIPIVKLRKNTTYTLWIELSAFAYTSEEGVYHQVGSGSLKDWILKTDGEVEILDALVIPDARTFEVKSNLAHLPINIKKIRDSWDHKFTIPQSPMASLRAGDDSFSFGRAPTQITTRDVAGRGAVAVSFWSRGIPVDEIAVPFCIVENDADECAASEPVAIGLRGIDSIRIAAQKGAPFPDASLHFLDLGTDQTVGVFRCNTCSGWTRDDFVAWQIDRSAQFIAQYLKDTIIQDFQNKATKTEGFRVHGQDLFYLLFRGKGSDTARQKFLAFVKSPVHSPPGSDQPPSLFIRLLPTSAEPLVLIPVGLMYVPDFNDFIGFHFRIETPLENQDYTTPNTCISHWVLLVPQENDNNPYDDMQQARKPFASYIGKFGKWSGHSIVYQDVDPFRDWLTNDNVQASSDAIFVLSHHDTNRIFFDPGNTIESVSVQRHFFVPTFAMLDGCGTAAPGAIEFVREFNKRGVTAEIAAATQIDPTMAGLFAATFIKKFQDNSTDRSYSVARALFDATLEISKMPMTATDTYGPRTLVYTMMGNGAITLCVPPSK